MRGIYVFSLFYLKFDILYCTPYCQYLKFLYFLQITHIVLFLHQKQVEGIVADRSLCLILIGIVFQTKLVLFDIMTCFP